MFSRVVIFKYNFNIIWQDENFLVIDKPPNILVHPSLDRNRPDLQSLIQSKFPKARLLHRLDFSTSGVLVFGFSKTAQELITQAQKFYFCMVEGQLSKQGLVKLYLKDKKAKVQSVHSGGKVAITEIKTVHFNKNYSLVRARLITGRRHQIRVSLAEYKCPIVGDSLYGGKPYDRLMLHAIAMILDGRLLLSSIPDSFKNEFPEFDFSSNSWFLPDN